MKYKKNSKMFNLINHPVSGAYITSRNGKMRGCVEMTVKGQKPPKVPLKVLGIGVVGNAYESNLSSENT